MCVLCAYISRETQAAPLLLESGERIQGLWSGFYTGIGILGDDGVIRHRKTTGYSRYWRERFSTDELPGRMGFFHSRTKSGGDARYAMLYDLPRYSDVKVGDTIVTSGNSSFFPEGVMVGRVEEAYPSTDGLYMTLKIQLSTQFSKLEHVFIMRKMDANELSALKELLNPTKKKK